MVQVEVFRGAQALYLGRARQVVLPGCEGQLAVWECHAPMLCVLVPGIVEIDEQRVRLTGGLACVTGRRLLILAR